jgi:hypothetical protein
MRLDTNSSTKKYHFCHEGKTLVKKRKQYIGVIVRRTKHQECPFFRPYEPNGDWNIL